MKFIDPHIHMYSRTTDDYKNMKIAGIEKVIEPAFWLGQERTTVGTMVDYWEYIISFERERAQEYGIKHYCTISLNPKEANNKKLAKESLSKIEPYLSREGVVGLGEIGFDEITKQEEEVLREQLLLAHKLNIPCIIHTPHIRKLEGTKKTIEIINEVGIDEKKVIIDHNTEETIGISLSTEAISGITVYPETKMSSIRVTNILKKFGLERIVINSSADWGDSDPLSVPKTALQMEKDGFTKKEIEKVLYTNPNEFFKQSKNY